MLFYLDVYLSDSFLFFFFKQKTAYEMRISDWSSDVCSSDMMQSLPALILSHVTINLPFLAWMLISFFEGEARQLEEAARVDGATRWQAFVRVAVPVAGPGILASGMLGFILNWNVFLFALVFRGPQTQTLPVGRAGRG